MTHTSSTKTKFDMPMVARIPTLKVVIISTINDIDQLTLETLAADYGWDMHTACESVTQQYEKHHGLLVCLLHTSTPLRDYEHIERKLAASVDLVAVALLSSQQFSDITPLLNAGVDDILPLPAHPTLIQRRVSNILRRHIDTFVRHELAAQLDAVFQSSPLGVAFYDTEMRYLRLNQTLADINGLPIKDHIGKAPSDLFTGFDTQAAQDSMRQVLQTGQSVIAETHGHTKNQDSGERIWVAAYYPITRSDNITGVGLFLHDITDQRQTEYDLRQSEERLRLALDTSSLVVFTTDLEGRCTWIPSSNLSGLDPKTVIGTRPSDFLDQDAAHKLESMMQYVIETENRLSEEFSYSPIDDTSHYTVLVKMTPLYDADDELMGILGSMLDITRIKRMEALIYQRELDSLQRENQALSAFAYTAAHDLKNPLATIMGHADTMRQYFDMIDEDEKKQILTDIIGGVEQMTELINALLLLARVDREDVSMGEVNMDEILNDVQFQLGYMLQKANARLTVPDSLPHVYGYAPWIREIWSNFISNAIKYGGKPPKIDIGAETLYDSKVRFWVRDNGDGLSVEQQLKLFAPFKRFHPTRAEGHGLGLTIVQHIIERLNGNVDVESNANGTTFSFTLPTSPPADNETTYDNSTDSTG